MDAFAGVTEIDESTAAVTVRVAELLTLPEVAMMVAVPLATPVATPLLLMVATELAEEVHVAVLVRFCVVPFV